MAMILSKSRLRVTEAKFFGNSQTAGNITSISGGQGITLTPDPIVATGTVALTSPVLNALGGTGADTSATGGAGQYVKQVGVGAAFTVGAPAATDLTGILGTANGGTGADLSATGGTSQYIKQAGVGVPFTVGTVPYTDVQNRIQWVNVVASGADPTGAADSTAAINTAIGLVPLTGGTLYFPAGSYKITAGLVIGNGTSVSPSTRQHITIRGDGPGVSAAEVVPDTGTSQILWYGAAAGTMLTIAGPMSGILIEGIHFHCNAAGVNAANTAISFIHPIDSKFSRISAEGYAGVCYDLTAYDGSVAVGFVTGANNNLWSGVLAVNGSTINSTGFRIGASSVGAAPSLDVASNVFIACGASAGGNGAGLELRYTDNLSFFGCVFARVAPGTGAGLVVTCPAGLGGTSMPANIAFNGGWIPDVGGGAGWTGPSGLTFFPWNDDRGIVPAPVNNFCSGFDTGGHAFGAWKFRDLIKFGPNALAPAPAGASTMVQVVAADGSSGIAEIDTFAAGVGSSLNFRRSRGTSAIPTGIQGNDVIGGIQAYGYGSTGYSATARAGIYEEGAEVWTDAAQGTRVGISTTANTTTTLSEKFAVENDGVLANTRRGLLLSIPGLFFSQTANSTTTANNLTTLLGTGIGTLTLPANFLTVGKTIRLRLGGYISAADGGAGTKTLTFTLGGVTVATIAGVTAFPTTLNNAWEASAEFTCRTTGGGGTVIGGARWETEVGTGTPLGVIAVATATAACNTTGTLLIDLKLNNGNGTGTATTTWATAETLT